MRTSLLDSLPLPILLVLFFLTSIEALAQDDPFGDSNANPFSGNRVNPGVKKVLELDDKQKIVKLESMLKGTQTQIHEMRQKNSSLMDALNDSQRQVAQLEARVTEKMTMHQRIFEQLLNSPDQKDQQLALDHLIVCFDNEGTGSDNLTLDPSKPEVVRRLSNLIDSDQKSIQRLAVRALVAIVPDTAIDMGFQFSPIWLPTTHKDTEQQARIYRAFAEQSNLNYAQVPISEVLEEIQQNYGISIALAKDLDQNLPITFRSDGLELADAFAHLLDHYDLAYRVIDNRVLIIKTTDPRFKKAETYNVRGLLTDKLDIAKLETLVMQSLEDSAVSIEAIDDNRIAVLASEVDQREVGRALASLADKANW